RNGRFYKLDLEGKILGTFGRAGHKPGTFGWVHEIACPSENLFVRGRVAELARAEAGAAPVGGLAPFARMDRPPSMKKISRRAAIGIFGAPLCGTLAQQNSPTRARISLAGEWGELRVPEPWPRSIRGNSARYERSVTIPAAWSGRRITLSADCVNSYAEVL